MTSVFGDVFKIYCSNSISKFFDIKHKINAQFSSCSFVNFFYCTCDTNLFNLLLVIYSHSNVFDFWFFIFFSERAEEWKISMVEGSRKLSFCSIAWWFRIAYVTLLLRHSTFTADNMYFFKGRCAINV